MKVNFYDEAFQTKTTENKFGLIDDENNTAAYINVIEPSKWNAIVINSFSKEITHTAIDNCIELRRENGEMDNRCDSMLTYDDNIVFAELKNKGAEWITEGIKQIEITINHFSQNHDLLAIKHKRAFVANRRHPNFHVIENETAKKFWENYRVRLNVDSEINIK
jgi:hypothetical protein